MTGLAVDYSGKAPTAAQLRAAGVTAILRYVAPPPNPKNLTRAEAQAALAAGIDVATVWESTGNRALAGRAAGAADGARAKAMSEACGAPAGAAIYYAVDFDANAAQLAAIGQYQAGFAQGIAPHPVGVYGGLATVKAMLVAGAARAWQTAAWSRGQRASEACLYQRAQQVLIGGTTCDVNEVLGPFGGWLHGNNPSPPPAQPLPPLPPNLTGPQEATVLQALQFPPLGTGGAGFWVTDGVPAEPDGKVSQGYPRPLIPWSRMRGGFINGGGGAPPVGAAITFENFGGFIKVEVSGMPNAAPLVWLNLADG